MSVEAVGQFDLLVSARCLTGQDSKRPGGRIGTVRWTKRREDKGTKTLESGAYKDCQTSGKGKLDEMKKRAR